VNKGATGALALILLWIAFASFFVAFHPGGIRDPSFVDPKNNPAGLARNPRDVLIWLMKRAAQGPFNASSVTPAATAEPQPATGAPTLV
jgi:hypothetical protein